MNIKDKVVIVTGGAAGIGLETARMFCQCEAKVAILDMNQESLDAAVQELGRGVLAVQCNVADEASVEKAFDQVVEHFGGIDAAVLNAGILRDGLLIKVDRETGALKGTMSLAQWQSVIDVNLTGVFLTGRAAAARMVQGKRKGVIIPISSISRHGNAGQSNYSAAKAGVAALCNVWGKELARYGIRVAGVAPGFIGTAMVLKDMKPEALEKIEKMIPIGRLGRPEEIAHAIRFVVENDMMTATMLEPSGGLNL